MAYTGAEIKAAIARQQHIARTGGEARAVGTGRVDYRIDATLFHNAVQSNRRVYGVQNCWAEPEFVGDMLRRHPELRVRTASGKTSVRMPGFAAPEAGLAAPGKMTRFGRVTFQKSYRKTG